MPDECKTHLPFQKRITIVQECIDGITRRTVAAPTERPLFYIKQSGKYSKIRTCTSPLHPAQLIGGIGSHNLCPHRFDCPNRLCKTLIVNRLFIHFEQTILTAQLFCNNLFCKRKGTYLILCAGELLPQHTESHRLTPQLTNNIAVAVDEENRYIFLHTGEKRRYRRSCRRAHNNGCNHT